ncbi:7554_t:CDS:2, partial [Scutellospora calospora]
ISHKNNKIKMNYNHSFDVSAELGHLLQSSEDFDVRITVGKDLDIKEFGAHSIILRARSEYFQKVLSRHWAPSDEFELHKLTECAQEHIIKYHSSWISSNLLTSLHILDHDPKNWNGQDLEAFNECVSRCIPLIRFCQISSNDYYLKVRKGFKKIIPEHIDELVLQYHLNPGTIDKSQIPPPRALSITLDSKNSNRRMRKALCEVPYVDENRKTLDSFIFSLKLS